MKTQNKKSYREKNGPSGIKSALQKFAKFILAYWQRNKKTLAILAVLAITVAVFVPHFSGLAKAQAAGGQTEVDKLYSQVSNVMILVMTILKKILWPIFILIGGLMKNDILFNPSMEAATREIFINIRNLVNILFVLALLGIAFYNVIGLGGDYQLKTILPHFVMAVIGVNFIYTGLVVVIDGVNVVSTAIFDMPGHVQASQQYSKEMNTALFGDTDKQEKICTDTFGKKDSTEYKNALKALPDDSPLKFCKPDGTFTKQGEAFFAKFDANNAALYMALQFGKIYDLDNTKTNYTEDIKTLTLGVIFGVIFYIVYASAYVALFFVLLARLIVLWITLALSPLIVLPYVLPGKVKESLGELGKLGDEFFKHAIAPIPIAVTLTIGYIMLTVLNKTYLSNADGATGPIKIDNLQGIMIAAAMVGIVWKGVFAAADNTIAKEITGKIRDGVKGAGEFIATSWQYIPMFPISNPSNGGKSTNVSLAAGLGTLAGVKDLVKGNVPKEKEDLEEAFGLKRHKVDMSKADNAKGWSQALLNTQGTNHDWKDTQKAAGTSFGKLSKAEQQQIAIPPGLTAINGEKVTIDNLKTVLEGANLSQQDFDKLISANKDKFKLTPETPKTKESGASTSGGTQATTPTTAPGAQEPQTADAQGTLAKAATMAKAKAEGSSSEGVLLLRPELKGQTDDIEARADMIKNPKTAWKNPADKAKAVNELDAKIEALESKIRELQTESGKAADHFRGAAKTQGAQGLETAIQQRMAELGNIDDDVKKKIIGMELAKAAEIESNDATKEVINKKLGSGDGKYPLPTQPAPVAAPVAAAKKAGASAGGAWIRNKDGSLSPPPPPPEPPSPKK